ncbi:paramyosin-like [Papaver somniferum]|uniref:paramyosin-like n=1 Tax=Papaver somniferum TaxID=3469 RepID=UPI000E6FE47E|nr:paramyosin-like [Papaver somniferum]
MANLVETRLVREKVKKDEALIKSLEKDLKEEKEHSSKQSLKMEKLLTALLDDMRALMTQNDCYVSENIILNEKVETLFSQVDRLSIDCSRNEELNQRLHDDNERLKTLHLSSTTSYKRLEEDYKRVISSKSKVVANLRISCDKVTDLNEEVNCLKTKVDILQAQLDNYPRPKPVNPSSQANPPGSRKNKGALTIQYDKDTSNFGHSKGWDNAYHELCVWVQDSDLRISELNHLYTDIQENLNTTLLHWEESEERHKSQVLRLSNERNESRLEASRLKNEVGNLNTDLEEMIETSAKVAKLARKNTQNYLVPLFDAYCDEHDIRQPTFPLEVFSDGEQPKEDEIALGEEEEFSEDGEDQKVVDTKNMGEKPKGASASTDAGLGGACHQIPETTVTDNTSSQQ